MECQRIDVEAVEAVGVAEVETLQVVVAKEDTKAVVTSVIA